MYNQRIQELRHQFKEFKNSGQKHLAFSIDCGREDRIDFIYSVIFPGWERPRFYFNFLIARIAQIIDYSPIKVFLYRSIGMKIGRGVFISPDVLLDPHFPYLIEIQDYCILGWGARLFCHESTGKQYRLGRIKIGEGTMVGAYSTIRNGVEIGKMVEIPYGFIVYEDVPDHKNLLIMEMRKKLKGTD